MLTKKLTVWGQYDWQHTPASNGDVQKTKNSLRAPVGDMGECVVMQIDVDKHLNVTKITINNW